jgi:hypothetical protein
MNFVYISPNFPQKHYLFCKELKSNGVNVLGIGDQPYYELSNELKENLTEYYYCILSDFSKQVQAIEYFTNKYGQIDYIESNNEYYLSTDAKLREIFNIKNGIRTKELNSYQSKVEMKKFYEQAGLKVARYCIPTSLKITKTFIGLVGYPVFVKPIKGVGASHSYKIENDIELNTFLNSGFDLSNFIMEEFLDGLLVSFDGITDDEANVVFSDQEIFPITIAEIINKDLDLYYYCLKEVDPLLQTIGCKVASSFNIKKRFFHFEFIQLTSDHPYLGKKGDYIPLEINSRPPGGNTPDLISISQSLSVYKIYSDIICYNKAEIPSNSHYYSVAVSRKSKYNYKFDFNNIITLYNSNVNYYINYPKEVAKAMGDLVVYAHFSTLEEMNIFDNLMRKKDE